MSATVTSPIPEIYVLWHSRCEVGEKLARRIHEWLRPGSGLGPQVFFRCLPAPEVAPRGLPPCLPGEVRKLEQARRKAEETVAEAAIPRPDASHKSNLQILIPLIDSNLIADPLWREWLRRLGENPPSWRVALPVAVDGTAYNVGGTFRNFNFLRPSGDLSLDPAKADELETGIRSVLKQLTESLCRLMLESSASANGSAEQRLSPKLKVFLSHAKVDGTGPAQALRNYIYSNTQLAAFYDENDIGYGRSFAQVIEEALDKDAAGMIAVRSLKYATRPWCRRELASFRKPRRKSKSSAAVQRWDLHALLTLEALGSEAETRGIPEFGNAPCLRWNQDCDTASLAELAVTTLIRNVMLGAFHSALADEIAATVPPGRIVINWLPDPVTLLHIPELRKKSKGEIHVIYPGQGMSGLELDILWELFPDVVCHSYEDVLSRDAKEVWS